MRGNLTALRADSRSDVPKTNKPLVRDGRLQAPKKRTDRSYLRPSSGATNSTPVEAPLEEEAAGAESADRATSPTDAFAPPEPAPAPAAAPAKPALVGKLPTTVRAIQQQGVRKRRDFDLGALARRDTSYAYHELRRIAALATMVIVTLVVLWFVLR
jgi:hypothetical protein